MAVYSTPGVYFEWLDAPQGIQANRTDIAGFVGIAERGPLHQPVRVESWTQFSTEFGGFIANGYLAYAVQGFFANGGLTCYVVRVADPQGARRADLDVAIPGGRRMRLTATSEGSWANRLEAAVLFTGETRFTLTLQLPDGTREIWPNLSLYDPAEEHYAVNVLTPRLANGQAGRAVNRAGSRLVIATMFDPEAPAAQAELLLNAPVKRALLAGGQDGLKGLLPEHLNGSLSANGQSWGLAALESVAQVGIVAIPDLIPPHEQSLPRKEPVVDCSRDEESPPESEPEDPADQPPIFSAEQIRVLEISLIDHCERLKDRVAVFQPPQSMINPLDLAAYRRQFDSTYAALYFPWLRVPAKHPSLNLLHTVPPCGHVAGIYARVENQRGVHKPPANELVENAQDVFAAVSDAIHGFLNDERINVIRTSAARGLRVMGERTLSSDSQWRYINVRRLLLSIERGIYVNGQWLVFEPNNNDLWREVDRVLRSFLDGLWRRGMLDGSTAEQAYLVECSEVTNSPASPEEGRLIAVIGVQPPLPAEFVVVRIGRTDSGLQFLEER